MCRTLQLSCWCPVLRYDFQHMELLHRTFPHRPHLFKLHTVIRTRLSLTRCQSSALVENSGVAMRLVATNSQSLSFGCRKPLALSQPDLRRVKYLMALIGLEAFLIKHGVNNRSWSWTVK